MKKNDFCKKVLLVNILQLLDAHWRKIFCWRTGTKENGVPEPPEGFEKSDGKTPIAFFDSFTEMKKIDPKEGGITIPLVCVIPEHRAFWDAILSFYLIFFPEKYPDIGTLADEFLHNIKKFGQGRNIQNFDPAHYLWLERLKKGETHLFFFKDPVAVYVAMYGVLWSCDMKDENARLYRYKILTEFKVESEEVKKLDVEWIESVEN